jgi:hypothetical protein
LLCPWDLNNCGDEWLGKNGDENKGVPIEWTGEESKRDLRGI